jgi:S-adenosylmethionine synthetase
LAIARKADQAQPSGCEQPGRQLWHTRPSAAAGDRKLDVIIEQQPHFPVARRQIEFVERKGIGHPDSICDAVMEAISVALSRTYLELAGQVLHHNIDKGLLVAGQTTPKLGGGTIESPMRLVVGDRATMVVAGKPIAIDELVETAARQWFKKHLRFVDPHEHIVIQNELRPGSVELVGIFGRGQSGVRSANDTSAAVGFAPLTEAEHLVLAAEHFLNSSDFKHEFPETGEDVKVMGVRRGRKLHLTVAMAFVDHHIWEEATYFHRKDAVRHKLNAFLETKLHALDSVDVQINTLDRQGCGLDGMYLTVLGTSAESADGGQVGRGNRVNGLISFCRPMTMEAAAGKNPVSHVGKVYNLLAYQIAESIHESLDAVEEVYVWLCSQIGRPLNDPWSVSAQVALAEGAAISDVAGPIQHIFQQEMAAIGSLIERLTRGELHVC